jgi:hypothetical protein
MEYQHAHEIGGHLSQAGSGLATVPDDIGRSRRPSRTAEQIELRQAVRQGMMFHLSISQLTKDHEPGNWKLHTRATSIMRDGWAVS